LLSCRATIDDACLQDRSSDVCVNDLVDKLLAADAAAAAVSGASKGSNPTAIAAGAAVAGESEESFDRCTQLCRLHYQGHLDVIVLQQLPCCCLLLVLLFSYHSTAVAVFLLLL
jgi:hypothetical protein